MSLFLFPTIPLTILIEGLALSLWCRVTKNRFLPLMAVLTAANILTQILLISALIWSPFRYWTTLLTMEALVVLIEAGILALSQLSWRKAFSLSLWINLISFTIGLFIPF